MGKLLSLLLVLVFPSVVYADEWKVERKVDAMTDRELLAARSLNSDGHSLSISRTPEGAVWATLRLSERSGEVLAQGMAPVYRVDKNVPRNALSARFEPKWVNFDLQYRSVDSGRSEQLVELMNGTFVVFRYFLFTGGSRETGFSLEGAGPAIGEALGLVAQLGSGALQAAEALASAVKSGSNACQANAVRVDYAVCMEVVTACADRANGDLRQYQHCLEAQK